MRSDIDCVFRRDILSNMWCASGKCVGDCMVGYQFGRFGDGEKLPENGIEGRFEHVGSRITKVVKVHVRENRRDSYRP